MTHMFLRRIARYLNHEHADLKKLPLLQYLANSCKQLMLNLYEIVTWYTFLKRI